jgi:hypothetical protein
MMRIPKKHVTKEEIAAVEKRIKERKSHGLHSIMHERYHKTSNSAIERRHRIYLQAQKEFEKSNGRGELCEKTPE